MSKLYYDYSARRNPIWLTITILVGTIIASLCLIKAMQCDAEHQETKVKVVYDTVRVVIPYEDNWGTTIKNEDL